MKKFVTLKKFVSGAIAACMISSQIPATAMEMQTNHYASAYTTHSSQEVSETDQPSDASDADGERLDDQLPEGAQDNTGVDTEETLQPSEDAPSQETDGGVLDEQLPDLAPVIAPVPLMATASDMDYMLRFNGDLNNDGNGGNIKSFIGTPKYSPDKTTGQAIELNGDNYIQLDDQAALLDYNQSFSVAFWINVQSTKGSDPVIMSNKNWSSGGNNGWLFTAKGNALKLNVKAANDTRINGTSDIVAAPFETGQWVHVAATFDKSTNKVITYANGLKTSESNTDLSAGIPGNGKPTFIGQSYDSGTTLYNGSGKSYDTTFFMDDFCMTNRVLNQNEIIDLYGEPVVLPKEPLTYTLTNDKANAQIGDKVTTTLTIENKTSDTYNDVFVTLVTSASNSKTQSLDEVVSSPLAPGDTKTFTWETLVTAGGLISVIAHIRTDGDKLERVYAPAVSVPTTTTGWYNIDTHSHTTNSDGGGTVAQNQEQAKLNGVSSLVLTDHNTSAGWPAAQDYMAQNPDMLPIWGNEYTTGNGHAVVLNINQQGSFSSLSWQNMIAKAKEMGALLYIAHPFEEGSWKNSWDDSGYNGLEVWNNWWGPRHRYNKQAFEKWDALNKTGRKLYGITNTDAHKTKLIGQSWMSVMAEGLTTATLMSGMEAGHMYGSNGPHLEMTAEVGGNSAMMGDTLEVLREGQDVTFHVKGSYAEALSQLLVIKNGVVEQTITIEDTSFDKTITLNVKPKDFVRVELEGYEEDGKTFDMGYDGQMDKDGKCAPFAFSNPIFFKGPSGVTEGKVVFGVLSDTHAGGRDLQAQRIANAVSFFNNIDGISALALAGDVTDNGSTSHYNTLKASLSGLDSDIQLVAAMGNHEGNTPAAFEGATGNKPNAHYVINGYHFITLSPGSGTFDASTGRGTSQGGGNYAYVADWAKQQLESAKNDDPTKPIFVFFHHPLKDTFYVSDEWYGNGLGDGKNSIFSDYPQAVTFSGHIHSPNNDPRSIWQDGGFTAVNTVSLYYFEMEKGMVYGTYPPNSDSCQQGLLVEADGSGVTIKTYDFTSGQYVDQVWTFDVTKPAQFPYTHARVQKAQKPVFKPNAAIAISDITENGAAVTFDQAILPQASEVGEVVHSYKYEIINKSTGATVKTFKTWSGFYMIPMPAEITQEFSGLEPGTEYEVRIYGIGSFQLTGDSYVSATFKTAGEPEIEVPFDPNMVVAPAEMLDVDFENQVAVDKSPRKLALTTGTGATFTKDEQLGKVVANFNQDTQQAYITSALSMEDYEQMQDAVTMEVVFKYTPFDDSYVDIVGNMQSAGQGLELADDGTLEYWIRVNNGSGHAYVVPRATGLEPGNWYHVAGVFDGKTAKIYLNGELADTKTAVGTMQVPVQAARKIVVGGDVTSSGGCEAPYKGAISLARVYTRSLSKNEVQTLAVRGLNRVNTITYETNGGTMPASTKYTYIKGTVYTLPTPVKEGFNFEGWFKDAGFTQVIHGIVAEDNVDMIVYAKWTEDADDGDDNDGDDNNNGGNNNGSSSKRTKRPVNLSTIAVKPTDVQNAPQIDETVSDESQTSTSANTEETIEQTVEPVVNFGDVDDSKWYYQAVTAVCQKGLFAGTSENAFEPNTSMTRGMFAAVLARLDGTDLSAYSASTFNDVDMDKDYFGPSVAWAVDNSILSGYGNGNFGPNDAITREQMAVILANYLKAKGISLPQNQQAVPLKDMDSVSSWAVEAVELMNGYGLINGVGENAFDPQARATRAQVAQIFFNFMQALEN